MQSLYYNVPGGKLNRGLSVVDTLEILKGSSLTDEEYFNAALLGWCIELVSVSECGAGGCDNHKLTTSAPGLLPGL